MRILHVLHDVDPLSGGPALVIRRLVREQVLLGHQVAILATSHRDMVGEETTEEFQRRMSSDPSFAGAEVFLGPSFGHVKPWSSFGYSPQANHWLRNRLRNPEKAPDIVHLHEVFYHLNGIAARVAKRDGIPFVMMPEGSLDALCLRLNRYWLKRLFMARYTSFNLANAAALIAASEYEERELRALSPQSRVVMVPHGVDPPEDTWKENARAFFERFPQAIGRRVVLCMARIDTKKRIDFLVKAAAVIRSEFPDLLLVVAGQDCGHLAGLQQMVADLNMTESVLFTGFLQGALREGAYAAASVFALVSLDENFGIVVPEAMIRGLPVLASEGVGTHVYVERSSGGLCVRGTQEDATRGLREILKMDGESLGQRGREFVLGQLGWPEIAREMDEVYKSAITGYAVTDRRVRNG